MKLQKYLKNRFLYLVLISFVFVVSASLSLSKADVDKSTINPFVLGKETALAPTPVLNEGVNSFPIMSAESILAVDIDSGITLYQKDPDKQQLPASTTKIVTALVALDYYSPDAVLTANKKAVSVDGQKMVLVVGEKIEFKDILYGLLVYSANDAAETIAANYPGGRDNFIAAMNVKARQLNLTNSHFANPSGLEEGYHVSTARDLVRVAETAMQNATFAKVVGTKSITVTSVDGKLKHYLTNINQLLGKVDGVMGVKTGWTENARENLVTYIDRDNRKVMIALLGSQDRFGETEELINWIFSNYTWKSVSRTGLSLRSNQQ